MYHGNCSILAIEYHISTWKIHDRRALVFNQCNSRYNTRYHKVSKHHRNVWGLLLGILGVSSAYCHDLYWPTNKVLSCEVTLKIDSVLIIID